MSQASQRSSSTSAVAQKTRERRKWEAGKMLKKGDFQKLRRLWEDIAGRGTWQKRKLKLIFLYCFVICTITQINRNWFPGFENLMASFLPIFSELELSLDSSSMQFDSLTLHNNFRKLSRKVPSSSTGTQLSAGKWQTKEHVVTLWKRTSRVSS